MNLNLQFIFWNLLVLSTVSLHVDLDKQHDTTHHHRRRHQNIQNDQHIKNEPSSSTIQPPPPPPPPPPSSSTPLSSTNQDAENFNNLQQDYKQPPPPPPPPNQQYYQQQHFDQNHQYQPQFTDQYHHPQQQYRQHEQPRYNHFRQSDQSIYNSPNSNRRYNSEYNQFYNYQDDDRFSSTSDMDDHFSYSPPSSFSSKKHHSQYKPNRLFYPSFLFECNTGKKVKLFLISENNDNNCQDLNLEIIFQFVGDYERQIGYLKELFTENHFCLSFRQNHSESCIKIKK